MRASGLLLGIATTATVVVASVNLAPLAYGDDFGTDISGTWQVFSDGEWARTNEVLIDQQSVQETWTVNTTCVSPIECYGEVTSSLGWTGSAYLRDTWIIEHEVPNWMPCPDGTFATGHQKFWVWGVDPSTEERVSKNITTLVGRNVTRSNSGACGVNMPKIIEMPVRIEKNS